MTLTEEIAKIARTSLEDAKLIRDYIDENLDLDWSECTNSQFRKAVIRAKFDLKVTFAEPPCIICGKDGCNMYQHKEFVNAK